jgi:hypothetical protein
VGKTNIVCIAKAPGFFLVGFLFGSVTQHNANAQLGDMGGVLLKKAGESSG